MILALLFSAAARSAEQAQVPEQAPKFDVLEYVIEGNSRLPDIVIERAVTPHLGYAKNINDVEAARASLELAYHDAGYLTVLVTIPEQKTDDGTITLSVVEGQVDRLRVKGADYHQTSKIKESVPELAEGNVPSFPEVQKQLETVNRSADLKATPVLKAGRLPGTVDVTLDVEDQLPLHGSVELNNRQTPFTHPLRLQTSLRYDNLWQRGHSINLSSSTAPQDVSQSKVFAATYVMPVSTRGSALALYAVHSSSDVPSFPTGAIGNNDVYGLRYATPLPPASRYSHSLSAGFDHKEVKQTLLVGGRTGISADTPSINYTPLVAAYNGAWLGEGSTTSIESTVVLNMRGLFGNSDDEFAAKRSGASSNFTVFKPGIKRTQTFGRYTFSAKLDAQVASGPLVPTEQYAAGGIDTVRGYYESEVLADDAIHYSIEGRTPGYGFADNAFRVSAIAFFDGVRLRNLQPLFPTPDYVRLRGAGVGLRVTAPRGVSMDLDYARALDNGYVTRSGDYRVLGRLALDF